MFFIVNTLWVLVDKQFVFVWKWGTPPIQLEWTSFVHIFYAQRWGIWFPNFRHTSYYYWWYVPSYPCYYLIGGLEHVSFFHILGTIIPTDFHIFRRGWNHQPVISTIGLLHPIIGIITIGHICDQNDNWRCNDKWSYYIIVIIANHNINWWCIYFYYIIYILHLLHCTYILYFILYIDIIYYIYIYIFIIQYILYYILHKYIYIYITYFIVYYIYII